MIKLRKIFLGFALCAMIILSGCGSLSVDHDLTNKKTSMVYTILTNMNSSPSRYLNKTFKIKGDIEGSSGYYSLVVFDETSCCSAELSLELESGVRLPRNKSNVIVVGEFIKIDDECCLKVSKIS